VRGQWRLRLAFNDCRLGDADLSDLKDRSNLFADLRDPDYLACAHGPGCEDSRMADGISLAPEKPYARTPSGSDCRGHPKPPALELQSRRNLVHGIQAGFGALGPIPASSGAGRTGTSPCLSALVATVTTCS
jgi:hypothetical protein